MAIESFDALAESAESILNELADTGVPDLTNIQKLDEFKLQIQSIQHQIEAHQTEAHGYLTAYKVNSGPMLIPSRDVLELLTQVESILNTKPPIDKAKIEELDTCLEQAYIKWSKGYCQSGLEQVKGFLLLLDSVFQPDIEFDLPIDEEAFTEALRHLLENGLKSKALILLKTQSALTEVQASLVTAHLTPTDVDATTKKAYRDKRVQLVDALLFSPTGHSMSGFIPKAHPKETLRPYHSFSGLRERQFLRHVATQLYLHAKQDAALFSTLQEIQIMHLEIDKRHLLFIVANNFGVAKDLQARIDAAGWEAILTTAHKPKDKTDAEGRIRSIRYAKKLSVRVFAAKPSIPDSDLSDKTKAEHVARLLKLGACNTVKYNSKNMNDLTEILRSKEGVYLLSELSHPDKARHGEEFLTDIYEFAKALKLPVSACVAGKKRPCMSCHGRMATVIDRHGRYHGRLWKHGIEHQPAVAASRTVRSFSTHSHISASKAGGVATDYDSGSDSEPE